MTALWGGWWWGGSGKRDGESWLLTLPGSDTRGAPPDPRCRRKSEDAPTGQLDSCSTSPVDETRWKIAPRVVPAAAIPIGARKRAVAPARRVPCATARCGCPASQARLRRLHSPPVGLLRKCGKRDPVRSLEIPVPPVFAIILPEPGPISDPGFNSTMRKTPQRQGCNPQIVPCADQTDRPLVCGRYRREARENRGQGRTAFLGIPKLSRTEFPGHLHYLSNRSVSMERKVAARKHGVGLFIAAHFSLGVVFLDFCVFPKFLPSTAGTRQIRL